MKTLTFKLALIFLIMASAGRAFAQTQPVSGTVRDASGVPIPGAQIVVEGTALGTTTDVDGHFQLDVPDAEKAVLTVSFIGYESQQIFTGGGNRSITLYSKKIRPLSTKSSWWVTACRRKAS